METVSVIIPAYNAENTLENALTSVCRQTYRNMEIIVVNDGSSDGTRVIADKIQRSDKRVIVRHIDHCGVSNARNIALKICHGGYVAFIDADDVMEESMIEDMVSCMERGIDLVCCGYKVKNVEGKILFQQRPGEGVWQCGNIYQAVAMLQDKKCLNMLWNKLFRADMIREKELKMDLQVSMGEDIIFLIAYLRHCTGGIRVISKCGYHYTLSSGGLQSSQNGEDNLKRRLNQLEGLYILYRDRQYPMDGICGEIMRCFYTSVMESEKPEEVLREIYRTDQYEFLCQRKIKYGIKYKGFLKLIQCSNIKFIVLAVRLFRVFKIISGRAFRW